MKSLDTFTPLETPRGDATTARCHMLTASGSREAKEALKSHLRELKQCCEESLQRDKGLVKNTLAAWGSQRVVWQTWR